MQARPAQQVFRARRCDNFCRTVEARLRSPRRPTARQAMECSQIKVVEVRVREKHDVDLRQFIDRQGRCSQSFRSDRKSGQTNSDSREESRIGENVDPKKVDKDSGVPEPSRGHACVAPLRRIRFRERGSNRSPAFNRPLAPEMREPISTRCFLAHGSRNELINGEALAAASAETVGEAASFPREGNAFPYNQRRII